MWKCTSSSQKDGYFCLSFNPSDDSISRAEEDVLSGQVLRLQAPSDCRDSGSDPAVSRSATSQWAQIISVVTADGGAANVKQDCLQVCLPGKQKIIINGCVVCFCCQRRCVWCRLRVRFPCFLGFILKCFYIHTWNLQAGLTAAAVHVAKTNVFWRFDYQTRQKAFSLNVRQDSLSSRCLWMFSKSRWCRPQPAQTWAFRQEVSVAEPRGAEQNSAGLSWSAA